MTSDDLRATIARCRSHAFWANHHRLEYTNVTPSDLAALVDAASSSANARNAALEEAAKVADRLAIHASDVDLQSGDDSYCYGAGYNCGACEYGVQIAEEIRALKEPTP